MPLKSIYYYSITLVLSVFLLSHISLFGQDLEASNWKEALSQSSGKERINLLLKISKKLIGEDLVLSDSLAIEGVSLSKKLGDSLSMYRFGAHLGALYLYKEEFDKALDWASKSAEYFGNDKALNSDKAYVQLTLANIYRKKLAYNKSDSLLSESENYFLNVKDLNGKCKSLITRGNIFYTLNEYDKVIFYHSEALKISEALEGTELIAISKAKIGLIYEIQGHYDKAFELQLEVISMDCSSLVKAISYGYIGRIYRVLKDDDLAIENIHKSIDLNKKIGRHNAISYNLTTIALVHQNQKNFGEALKYNEEALALKRKHNTYIGPLLGVIGNTYNQIGQPLKADKYYAEFLKLAEERNDWNGIWNVNHNRGFYKYSVQKYDEALTLLLVAYKIAEEKKSLRLLKHSHEMLSYVYDKLDEDKKAKYHREQKVIYIDSLTNIKKLKKIGVLEQKYRLKLYQDSLISAAQEGSNEAPKKEFYSGYKFIGLLLFLSLFLLLLGVVFLRTRPTFNKNSLSNNSKIDQYFEELFSRLDQNLEDSEGQNLNSSHNDVRPLNDMSEYLKTNLSSPSDWASFEQYFTKVHKDFFKDLKATYPLISINELNMCALLKLNVLNKDIAQIMGISPDSVRKAQNRLSKKLALSEDEVLRDFVLKL